MKMTLTLNGSSPQTGNLSGQKPAIDYVKVVFAHISPYILIKSVSKQKDSSGYTITVDFEKNSGCDERTDLEALIREAVSLRGGLSLAQIDTIPQRVWLTGLQEVEKKPGSTRYYVRPIFAEYLAENVAYCNEHIGKNVTGISFAFDDMGNFLEYTGIIRAQTAPTKPIQPSAYNVFLLLMRNNEDLRAAILTEPEPKVFLIQNDDGTSGIEICRPRVEHQASPSGM